jgi:hypothetical protein
MPPMGMDFEFEWVCPFCERETMITSRNYREDHFEKNDRGSEGQRCFKTLIILCPNHKCRKFTLTLTMYDAEFSDGRWNIGKLLQTWNLIPMSTAKVFPDYVPTPVRDDYAEACLIKDLSPKASATLSRRCLQGMIRHFWGVSKSKLIDEIYAIKDKTDTLVWEAIDGVRKIGNIGAHMEKDINVVLDVDPNEAQLLIGLIELLVKDWYIARHDREKQLKNIVALSQAKAEKPGR